MSRKTACPHCRTPFEVSGDHFNTVVSCQTCATKFNPMQEYTKAAWELTKTPEFQAALALAPGLSRARYQLAVCWYALGKTAEARAEFDRVAKETGGSPACATTLPY